jgi:ADP-ribose pyrophosphatase YjhB (NUDIX family)
MDEATNAPEQPDAFLGMRPDLNYCAVCGTSLEDRYTFGRERRYCPHCQQTVFREHKVAAAALITRTDGSVLLVQRAQSPCQGLWSLPAGFVDFDETPVAAAVRECLEETGLEIEITELLEVLGGQGQTGGADIVIVYRGVQTGGALIPGDDASDAKFFSLDRLPTLAFTSTHRTLKRWRRELNEEGV